MPDAKTTVIIVFRRATGDWLEVVRVGEQELEIKESTRLPRGHPGGEWTDVKVVAGAICLIPLGDAKFDLCTACFSGWMSTELS